MKLELSGLFAPLVTPFTDAGESVSEVRLARLVRHLIEKGVDGFVTSSITGEFTTTTTSERKSVLEIVMREAGGRPVLAHCTRLGTLQTLDLVRHAGDTGARAAIVMPPYFGSFSDEEIENHIRTIAHHASIPVVVLDPAHCLRSNTRSNLSTLSNLCYAESMEGTFNERFGVFPAGPGSDEFVLEEAIISPMVQLDVPGCRSEKDLRPLSNMIARYGRARVAKAALNGMEIEVGPPRTPTLPLDHEHQQELLALL